MATFEGNSDHFNYGAPQDFVTFTAVASSERTRLEIRSDRHGSCAGATVGVCTVKSSSGYAASKKVKAGFRSEQSNKTGFVLRNVSGLKAGEAIVFTPASNQLFKQYRTGMGANNFLEEGWNGGYSFYRRTDTTFDLDEPPTHAETWIEEGSEVHLALFEGNVDTDSSYEDPLLLISQASFARQADPETYPIQRFNKTARFDPDDLVGVEGRKYSMRFTSADGSSSSAGPVGGDRIRWIANYNPRAHLITPSPYEREDENGVMPLSGLGTVPNYRTYVARVQDDQWNVSVSGSGDQPFVGYSHDAGPVQGVLYEIPKEDNHFHSIGQLMHANLSAPGHNLYKESLAFESALTSSRYGLRGLGFQPSYAIGNSLADPRIPLGQYYQNLSLNDMLANGDYAFDAGMHYDYSYLLNDALWDAYFFSTVPRDLQEGNLDDATANKRIKVYYNQGLPPIPEDLLDYGAAAANLMVDGAFNVNSTSVEAWASFLANVYGAEGSSSSSGTVSFPRLSSSTSPAEEGADSAAAETYVGYRQLDSEEINALAKEIVDQIRLRAQRGSDPRPFVSLSEFVNRSVVPEDESPYSADSEEYLQLALKGPLQAAIDEAGLNDRYLDEVVVPVAHQNFDQALQGGNPKPGGARSAAGPAASNAPGFLTQADLLARLGPSLAVRSDTFRVRAFGEVLNPNDSSIVEAKAFCEAIFQRVPEADVEEGSEAGDNTEWNGLHREFKLVEFRWISPQEM